MNYWIIILLFAINYTFNAKEQEKINYVTYSPKKGEKLEIICKKFHLPFSPSFKTYFHLLNKNKIKNIDKILWGISYKLPIIILNNDEFELNYVQTFEKSNLDSIKSYNRIVERKGIKLERKTIWIPFHLDQSFFIEKTGIHSPIPIEQKEEEKPKIEKAKKEKKVDKFSRPYYGKKYKSPKYKSKQLKNFAFYLVSGHGGIDPGAIGYYKNYELHEDEYAYDITLRLARELESHGAKVFMITIDTADGIRNDEVLKPTFDELYHGGIPIPDNQKERLQLCANIVNQLYNENKDKYKHHISVNIHLDSRSESKKIDVFFYYQENNPTSIKIGEILLETFRKQYEINQPGRGYSGTLLTRNLFMIRNTIFPTIYIELGNIRNPNNQVRFLKSSNREALAKWLALGFLNYKKKLDKK